jgi:sporulation protein YabP
MEVSVMSEDKKGIFPHNCILEDRKRLSVSGVNNVGSFDEETIVAITDYGEMTIRGQSLHITKLSLEVGELVIEGSINGLQYADVIEKSGGFLSRVFR